MNREEFLEDIAVIREEPLVKSGTLITVTKEEKKLLSGGFYFLQEFFKKRLEESEQFQKILRFEYENREFESEEDEIDLDKTYFLEVFLYNNFFERFPSAKKETEYFVTEGDGSCAVGDATNPKRPDWYWGINHISWRFTVENGDDPIFFNITTEIHRRFENGMGCLASMSLYQLPPDRFEETSEIITYIYK